MKILAYLFGVLCTLVIFGLYIFAPKIQPLDVEAQNADYEWDVLSGVQINSGGTFSEILLTTGWHGPQSSSLDIVPSGKSLIRCQDPNDHSLPCVTEPVHAVFRNSNQKGADLEIVFIHKTSGCKGVTGAVIDPAGASVSKITYTHVVPSISNGTTWKLSDLSSAKSSNKVGDIAVPYYDNYFLKDLVTSGKVPKSVQDYYEDIHKNHPHIVDNDCPNGGPHLHQTGIDYRNENTKNSNLGIGSSDYWCVPSSIWGWKISSRSDSDLSKEVIITPAVSPSDYGWKCPRLRNLTIKIETGGVAVAITPTLTEDQLKGRVPNWSTLSKKEQAQKKAEEEATLKRTVSDTRTGYYAGGGDLTLEATASPISLLTGWTGCKSSSIDGYGTKGTCAVTMDADKTVTPVFSTAHGLKVTWGTGGSVVCKVGGKDVDCSRRFLAGTTVTLTAKPSDDTYRLSSWTVTGGSGGTGTTATDCSTATTVTCTVTMGAAKNVEATFAKKNCTATVNTAGTGSGTVTGTTSVPCGTSTTLTAVPNSNSTFTSWSGCTSISGAVCTVTVNSGTSVTATFTLDQCAVTVSTAGTGSGSVSGITSGTCGASTTLTAVPNSNSTFTSWSGCASTSGASCTVTMNSGASVTATFTLKPTCTVAVSTAGTGSGSVTGITSGYCGTSTTLTAVPNSNSTFTSWSGCTSTSGASCTVTVNSGASVTATFTLKQCAVSVSTAGTGSGTVTGTTSVPCGTSTTLTAVPNSNSNFTSWSGCTSTSGANCTVTVNSGASVTATFTLKPTCTVSVSTAGTGSGSVTGTTSVYCGTSTTLTAVPNSDSNFTSWSGCTTTSGATCTVTVNSGTSVTATFSKKKCTLTVNYGSGGTAGPGTSVVDCGTKVSIWANASTGYCFTGWSTSFASAEIVDESAIVQGSCTTYKSSRVTVSVTMTVTANFERLMFTLTVTGGSGSGSYGAYTYASASAPASKCVLGTRYTFKRWSGDSTSTSRSISVYMNRNKSIAATWNLYPFSC